MLCIRKAFSEHRFSDFGPVDKPVKNVEKFAFVRVFPHKAPFYTRFSTAGEWLLRVDMRFYFMLRHHSKLRFTGAKIP